MKTTFRTYPVVCKSCHGVGQITNVNFDPNVTTCTIYITCPACNGSGVVTVQETVTDDYGVDYTINKEQE